MSIIATDRFMPVSRAQGHMAPCTDRTIAIVGLGYVGLPTALAFAHTGHQVIGLEVSEERIARIRAGDVDLTPDDARRLEEANGRTDFQVTGLAASLRRADTIVVCAPRRAASS